MKKIWQEFKSFIKMISKGKKDVAVVMAAGGFMKASIPFLVFYFSAQILNNAIEGDYKACVKSVAALLLSQFVCELVIRFCRTGSPVHRQTATVKVLPRFSHMPYNPLRSHCLKSVPKNKIPETEWMPS